MADSKPIVLITGANGFIGSRLCRRFLSEGFEVIAGVRRTADLSALSGLGLQYRYGDVTVPDSLPDMVSGVDYIIHNAGVTKVKRGDIFFDVNATGTKHLFGAVAKYNPSIRRVIYVSSVAVAGPSLKGIPVTENDPPNPVTIYGRSKAEGEKTALSYSDRLPVVAVRPPGVYGPGEKELHALFKAVYHRLKPYIGNLSRRLQLVHVEDLCRGIVLATTAETKTGTIYFIAERQSYTMRELIRLLGKACGRKGIPLFIPSPIFRLIAACSEFAFKLVGATPMLTRNKTRELLASWEVSTERARREIGFESMIPFERGAKETYDWYLKEGWL